MTSLDLTETELPEHCYTALEKLISLPFGRIESLSFQSSDRLMSVVSGPSSLSTLCISNPQSSISSICCNTCITRLELINMEPYVAPDLVEILKCNKTLLHLKLGSFSVPSQIDALRDVTDALSENSTLQCMEVGVKLHYSAASSSDDPDPDKNMSQNICREDIK